MDTAKLSLSPETPHVNNGESSRAAQEEVAAQWADRGGPVERHKVPETDSVDGSPFTTETHPGHWGAANVRQKFNSMGYRKVKQRAMADFSTVKGPSAATKTRTPLKNVLFQGVSDKSHTPEEQLHLESLKQALHAYRVPVDLKWAWEEPSKGTALESSWMDIVASHSTMSRIQRHQQEAMWEFVHTELTYINKLTVIKELVIAALLHLQQNGFLLEITPRSLFVNLPLVLNAHRKFWKEVIYPMLQEVRRTGRPFDPRSLEAGCLQFSERFASYIPYCCEQENTIEFAKKQTETNPHFLVYLTWVETHPRCDRMRLGDMQAKPHQRITKYPLLLKAVLENTADPQIQQTIIGMLSSVTGFLTTVNESLRMDEQQSLYESAQRVEGYEVPGINEEIDKHLREICHFDLTRPMAGVAPKVVRKLLLEENLKLRGRKDIKEDVVALLFSDVLLMTKVQKKSEKLKVVLPPLALHSTHCVALKDSYSFLLVEESDLGCTRNVYVFVTPTAERCSTWVSTIHQAKDALRALKETEKVRELGGQRIQHFDSKPIEEAEEKTMEAIGDYVELPLSDEPIITPLGNGAKWPKEQRVTWNHKKSSVATRDSGLGPQSTADHLPSKVKEGQKLFMGKYPEIDYPTAELVSDPVQEVPSFPIGGTEIPKIKGYNVRLVNHKKWTDPSRSLSPEDEASPEERKFSRKLKSPRIRKKSPNSSQQGEGRIHWVVSGGSEMMWLTPNSSSNSDSDYNQNPQGNVQQNHTNNGTSHRVLKLGSLRPDPGMSWNTYEGRVSPEPETFSEPEFSLVTPEKRKSGKGERSFSIPDILASDMPRIDTERCHPYFRHRHASVSPVEGLLERAKVRGQQTGRNEKIDDTRTLRPPPSPFWGSETPSPSPSDGDQEMEMMRHHVPTISQRWREQLVDGDADDKYSNIFVNETNVDWPGWSFDDEEVLAFIKPTDERNASPGILDDINKTFPTWNIKEHTDAKISQV